MNYFETSELESIVNYMCRGQVGVIGGFDAESNNLRIELTKYISVQKRQKVLCCSLSKEKAALKREDGLEISDFLQINDTPGLTIESLRNELLLLGEKYKLPKVLIIDDFILMGGTKKSTRMEEVESVLNMLRWMAVELGISIVLLAYFGRNLLNRLPELSDFREYGNVLSYVDTVVLVGRTTSSCGNEEMQSIVVYRAERKMIEKGRSARFHI